MSSLRGTVKDNCGCGPVRNVVIVPSWWIYLTWWEGQTLQLKSPIVPISWVVQTVLSSRTRGHQEWRGR